MASDVPFAEFPKMGVLIKGRFNAKQRYKQTMVFRWALQGIKYFPPRYNQNVFRRRVNCQTPPLKKIFFILKKFQTKTFLQKKDKNEF